MLELCGFSASNYYNKVKLALLERDISFSETRTYPSGAEALLADSPMGKVPYLRLSNGCLSESQAIVEYLEDVYPDTPLYPADPFERARCRQLIQLMELYLELPARRLYPAAFFGGTASDELKKEVQTQIARGVRALARLARFAPCIGGAAFTYADCAAVVHLPLVSATCKTMFSEDLLASMTGLREYLAALGQRPHVQRVNADRKASLEEFIALRTKVQADAKAAAARVG